MVYFIHYGLMIWGLLSLMGCVSPIYEGSTYGLDEFVADSGVIAQGKLAILHLEEKEEDCLADFLQPCEEKVLDGDELAIVIYDPWRPERLESFLFLEKAASFCVCEGKLTLPCVSALDVAGLTLCQVRDQIRLLYRDEMPGAQVFVNFKSKRERCVQVIGARYPLVVIDQYTRLSQVLAKAQLPFYANLFKSYVVRRGKKLPIDLYKLIHEGDESQNVVMCDGDQIFIAFIADSTVMVMGEVRRPQVFAIPYGFISLRQVLAAAGGIPYTGEEGCIQIIRGNLRRPKIYQVDWKDISHLPNSWLLLMPGDVVYISETRITQWNRFISQLLPSTLALFSGYGTYNICCSLYPNRTLIAEIEQSAVSGPEIPNLWEDALSEAELSSEVIDVSEPSWINAHESSQEELSI